MNEKELKEIDELATGIAEEYRKRIKELESQLKPCDDAGVKEIEKRLLKTPFVSKQSRDDVHYLLSYLRRGTCCNLLCQTEKLQFEAELNKWKSPHEDNELQQMKEQSKQSSLSAKQAYINALEWKIKHSEKRIEELEIQLQAADEGMLKSSDPNNPWQGIHAECLGWKNRAEQTEARVKELRKQYIDDIRFWSKVEIKNPAKCWNWRSTLNNKGYGRYWDGQLSKNGKKVMTYAHRMAYEKIIGEIPDVMTLDHQCRNPKCINPAHLKPMTMKENILNGIGVTAQNARKALCKHGHELVKSPYKSHHGGRYCPICQQLSRDRHRKKLVENK